MPKLTVFDTSSQFAFFRKNFTTVNALTFSVIPRSTVQGLIGSIIGLSSKDFPDLLKDSKIAVQLLSKVRKLNMKYMHINHDWWHGPFMNYLRGKEFESIKGRPLMSTQASVELLRDVKYRLYVDTTNEEINDKLTYNLRNKQSYYTPYLGSSSHMCSLRYVGELEYEPMNNGHDYLSISSVAPFTNNKMPKLDLKSGVYFASEEDIPIHIDNERRTWGTYSLLYNTNLGDLRIGDKEVVKVNDDTYIKFLPTS